MMNRNTLRRMFPHVTIPKGKEGKQLTSELSMFVSSTIMGCGYEARDFNDYLEFARDNTDVKPKHWAEFHNAFQGSGPKTWAVVEKGQYAYFQNGIRQCPWKALGSPTPQPEQKKAPSPEDRMMFAFENGPALAAEFLKFFEETDKAVLRNYERLAKEQGVFEQFRANPLGTIITMRPGCCFPLAKEFIDDKMTNNLKN